MNRSIAILFALLMTSLCLTSVGIAAEVGTLRYGLETARGGAAHLTLTESRGRDRRISVELPWTTLQGLDRSAKVRAQGPVAFALVRDAGRIDCAGTSSKGSCRFTANADFAAFLSAQGYPRPSTRQSLDLVLVGVGRPLVGALAAAGYERPSLADLSSLAALGVTPASMKELAASGHRPESTGDLLAFAALGITAEYIRSFERAGLPRLSSAQLIQCKAMNIRAEDLRQLGSGKMVSVTADELIDWKVAGLLP